MSTDDEVLGGFPSDQPALPLDLSPWADRVAELLRTPGVPEHWRRRCAEAFGENRERLARYQAWERRPGGGRPALPTAEELEQLPRWALFDIPGCNEPYVGGPLPFSPRHRLSIGDCFLVLAVIHDDRRRDGARIDPFEADDKGALFFEAMRSHLAGLREEDRITLDDCLARALADLAAARPAPQAGGESQAAPVLMEVPPTSAQAAADVQVERHEAPAGVAAAEEPAPPADPTPPPEAPRPAADVRAGQHERPAGDTPPGQYVTLDKMAAVVGRSKRTLEKLLARPKKPMPPPDVEGGGGKPNEWLWEKVRPWLQEEYGRTLPERFPGDRFRDGRADRS
jgi:hypothetical protein